MIGVHGTFYASVGPGGDKPVKIGDLMMVV